LRPSNLWFIFVRAIQVRQGTVFDCLHMNATCWPSSLVEQNPRRDEPAAASEPQATRIAVVIPCYRVAAHILGVIRAIGPEVHAVYVVDDKCPENSGELAKGESADPRVRVLFHAANQGVGGATMTGMRQALADGAQIIVKVDGDGQMDPGLLPLFVESIRSGDADYAKGNRFFDPDGLDAMPLSRIIGNAGVSLLAKLSTGYWRSLDPTNGYIAIHAKLAARLPYDKINRRYFFESDLLFRLNILQAKVVDVPMRAVYRQEVSNLRPGAEILPFLRGHMRNFVKRIIYNYFLRNFSIASIELVLGILLLAFGTVFGLVNWSPGGVPATAGTVMLAAMPVILGFQLLLAFINYDIQSVPTSTLHTRL
jgi:dolichol-phosphate mannosyltransferase